MVQFAYVQLKRDPKKTIHEPLLLEVFPLAAGLKELFVGIPSGRIMNKHQTPTK